MSSAKRKKVRPDRQRGDDPLFPAREKEGGGCGAVITVGEKMAAEWGLNFEGGF